MKYEKLNKNYTKIIIMGLIVIIIIGSVLVLNITKSKYKTTVSVPIVNGTIKYSGGYDFKIMALYQQKENQACDDDNCYESIDRMPYSGYVINTDKSYCSINGNERDTEAKLYTENGKHIIENLAKNEKCYLYFDRRAESVIIANSNFIEGIPDFTKTTCDAICADSNSALYKIEDDFGDSYYFRGTVENNWVKFGKMGSDGADIYWRIIRINGDGTIRLIYSGNDNPAITGAQTNALSGSFNGTYGDNMYAGYEYQKDIAHGRGTKSSALTTLEKWFETNLVDEWNNGDGRIDINAGFCNDRSNSTNSNITWQENLPDTGGTGNTYTYYGGFLRIERKKDPMLKCSTNAHKNDDYFTYEKSIGIKQNGTVSTIIKGTQSLKYPIGIITADEVVFAGGVWGSVNSGFWLHTDQNYWTMTPDYFSPSVQFVFSVVQSGGFTNLNVSNSSGFRPVINLKANTKFTFEHENQPKGTSSNPYIVS